ncbi:MAG: tRNA (N(6)-L-threonylcarbamoyladenosine(37)-C(2))-methylthiotransferase MtaB [Butyrivibrio sp.]|nr:tRNA (N(6)-L-threonylcarbamoyladenosine(37)-C(2))-methylthiotransferase MtaB [Butyrivibrio sp.]
MESIALHNLGCKVNGYEMEIMQQMLSEKGYKIVPFEEKADIYIVNTCTVTNIADRKSRQMLHRAKKLNPKAIVVAVGCYVQTGKDAIEKDSAIDLVIGNNRKKDVVEILEEYLDTLKNGVRPLDKSLNNRTVIDINVDNEYEEMRSSLTMAANEAAPQGRENAKTVTDNLWEGARTRAYIKIQDGCNQFCSYCIIPYARGRVRSRREEDILAEASEIVKRGCKEVVLTGIHISSYGVDRGESELLQLLHKLNDIEGLRRIRLGSLEPGIVTEEFVKEIAALNKVCPHFHLSLQSGCDETLRRMNRHYTTGEYLEKVDILRKYFQGAAITTDVIVGFPGETDEEFECTEKFLDRVHFYEMHIFKYSQRQGTRAASMEHQIPDEVKSERSNRLIKLESRLSEEYRQGYIGRELEVLFEEAKEINGHIYQIGHTREYVKVALETAEDLSNQIRAKRVTGFLTKDILM